MIFDVESIQFCGPTMLMQYESDKEPGKIYLHDVFSRPCIETLELIHRLLESTIVGYHLSMEGFHLSRTLNILGQLEPYKPPDPYEYREVEMSGDCQSYCAKPYAAVDLLIVGRRGRLQSTMRQKPIVLRRIQRDGVEDLVDMLNDRIEIPNIYFSKKKDGKMWIIEDIHEGTSEPVTGPQMRRMLKGDPTIIVDPDFVNVKLSFAPGASLKTVAKYMMGFEDTEAFEQMGKKYDERSWYPNSGDWIEVFNEQKYLWENNLKKREYAKRDIIYTKAFDDMLGNPEGDHESMLAVVVGNMHWCGYAIDQEETSRQFEIADKIVNENNEIVEYNKYAKVLDYLREVCNPIEQMILKDPDVEKDPDLPTDTKAETLRRLQASPNRKLAERCTFILDAKDTEMEHRLLKRLNVVGRLHCTMMVSGTRTNRASGGDAVNKNKESINPQGIKKGILRKCFILKDPHEELAFGDFSGFEVSIYDAVYKDPVLGRELRSGKSMHGLWGALLYDMPYDEIMETEGIKASKPNGIYSRSKNSFFASLYGAMPPKIASITWLMLDVVTKAYHLFNDKYITVKEAKNKVEEDFSPIVRDGKSLVWKDPKMYAESIMGFKRSFEFEFNVVKQLFDMANDLPREFTGFDNIVKRREKEQTGRGALMSSLYSAAFSLVNSIIRVAGNFYIQSPGGEITKLLQSKLTELQPQGIHVWRIKTLNIHDELQVVHIPELRSETQKRVKEFVKTYSSIIPLLAIDWKVNRESWYEKK